METLASIVNKKIKPSLVKEIGIALATLVILQSSKQCGVMVANIDDDGYKKLINTIVVDKRMVRIFDAEKITALKSEWLKYAE